MLPGPFVKSCGGGLIALPLLMKTDPYPILYLKRFFSGLFVPLCCKKRILGGLMTPHATTTPTCLHPQHTSILKTFEFNPPPDPFEAELWQLDSTNG